MRIKLKGRQTKQDQIMKPTVKNKTTKLTGLAIILCGSLMAGQCSAQQLALEYPIVWVGNQPPSDTETVELWWDVMQFQTNASSGLAALEAFVTNHVDSPWTPSLHSNLGYHYRKLGRDSLALEHW